MAVVRLSEHRQSHTTARLLRERSARAIHGPCNGNPANHCDRHARQPRRPAARSRISVPAWGSTGFCCQWPSTRTNGSSSLPPASCPTASFTAVRTCARNSKSIRNREMPPATSAWSAPARRPVPNRNSKLGSSTAPLPNRPAFPVIRGRRFVCCFCFMGGFTAGLPPCGRERTMPAACRLDIWAWFRPR